MLNFLVQLHWPQSLDQAKRAAALPKKLDGLQLSRSDVVAQDLAQIRRRKPLGPARGLGVGDGDFGDAVSVEVAVTARTTGIESAVASRGISLLMKRIMATTSVAMAIQA